MQMMTNYPLWIWKAKESDRPPKDMFSYKNRLKLQGFLGTSRIHNIELSHVSVMLA